MSQYEPVEPPISTNPPTEADRVLDRTLEAFMKREIVLDNDETMLHRGRMIVEIERVFREWVQYVAKHEKHLSEDDAAECGGQLFVSGSHRLGIMEPGADIDTVCVAPNFCTRDHFFDSLKKRLLALPDLRNLDAIETARVPVMSFELQGVAFDLLFAKLAENIVPKNLNIFDDRILRNLEKESELSLNGPRVTDMIRHLVPKFENFVIVLRCIRKWAKARGIYGNKFGYLGGVNFNILVAFVCQLYPNASPSMLLVRFFRVYSAWKWPSPIMLNRIQPNPPGELRDIWTKEIGAYSGHVMPLITPAYPAANSTANVSEHTLAVMVKEFTLGNEIVRGIISKKADAVWDPLFKPTDFFVAYEQYLCCHIVGSISPEESDVVARSWIGFAESRLRHFPTILGLRLPITPIHFHPKEYKSPKGHIAVMYFIGFNVNSSKFKPGEEKVLHVDSCVQELKDNMSKFERSGSMNFIVEHLPWRRLPEQVFEPLGGRPAAKEMRNKTRGISTKGAAVAASSSSAAASTTSSAASESTANAASASVASAGAQASDVKVEPSAKRRKVGENGEESVHFAGDSEGLIQYDEKDAASSQGAMASPDSARRDQQQGGAITKDTTTTSAPDVPLPKLTGRGMRALRAWNSGKFEKLPAHLTENHPSFAPIHITWKFLE